MKYSKKYIESLDEEQKKNFDPKEIERLARAKLTTELHDEMTGKVHALYSKKYGLLTEIEKAVKQMDAIKKNLTEVDEKIQKVSNGNYEVLFKLVQEEDDSK